jgi:chromosomal replication initiation ATPase DnaA
VAEYYGLEPSSLRRRHDHHIARAVAAWLCRRYTEASLRDLAVHLGLSRADSVPNLTRRVAARLPTSPDLAEDLEGIMRLVAARIKRVGSRIGSKAGRTPKPSLDPKAP